MAPEDMEVMLAVAAGGARAVPGLLSAPSSGHGARRCHDKGDARCLPPPTPARARVPPGGPLGAGGAFPGSRYFWGGT